MVKIPFVCVPLMDRPGASPFDYSVPSFALFFSGESGILLLPSSGDYAYYHNQPVHKPFNYVYTAIFNILGFPVTQVPLGLGSKGLPLGLQIAAAPDNDRLTLAVAEELDSHFGGWVEPQKAK